MFLFWVVVNRVRVPNTIDETHFRQYSVELIYAGNDIQVEHQQFPKPVLSFIVHSIHMQLEILRLIFNWTISVWLNGNHIISIIILYHIRHGCCHWFMWILLGTWSVQLARKSIWIIHWLFDVNECTICNTTKGESIEINPKRNRAVQYKYVPPIQPSNSTISCKDKCTIDGKQGRKMTPLLMHWLPIGELAVWWFSVVCNISKMGVDFK